MKFWPRILFPEVLVMHALAETITSNRELINLHRAFLKITIYSIPR